MTAPAFAKLAYLTHPAPDVYLLNFQYGRDVELHQVQISKAQLGNILVDGAGMALRECDRSVRLGAESFGNAPSDKDDAATVAQAARDLGQERS